MNEANQQQNYIIKNQPTCKKKYHASGGIPQQQSLEKLQKA